MSLVHFLICFWKELSVKFLPLNNGGTFSIVFRWALRTRSSLALILFFRMILKNIRVWDMDWKLSLQSLTFSSFFTEITRFFLIYLQMVLPESGSSLILLIWTYLYSSQDSKSFWFCWFVRAWTTRCCSHRLALHSSRWVKSHSVGAASPGSSSNKSKKTKTFWILGTVQVCSNQQNEWRATLWEHHLQVKHEKSCDFS